MYKTIEASLGGRAVLWVVAALVTGLTFVLLEGGIGPLLEAINDLF